MQLECLKLSRLFKNFSEDAEKLRMHTSSEAGDMESLERMVGGSDSESESESEDTSEGSSHAP